MKDVLIIGAGLTGLTLANELKKKGIDFHILEARDRIGGRILTAYQTDQASIELGATWLGKKHTALVDLLKELAQLPPNPEPSYRIAGGSSTLIRRLAATFDESHLSLNTVVKEIHYEAGVVEVRTDQETFTTRTVVSTLPPRLLRGKVIFSPTLPSFLEEIAANTHTWMGESIKVGLRYAQPFWRKPHTSGSIFSNVGPVTEMYDHSDESVSYFALRGFLNGSFQSATSAYRRGILLKQLERYYGNQVYDFLSYEEWGWSQEPYTYTPYEGYILPHQHNGLGDGRAVSGLHGWGSA